MIREQEIIQASSDCGYNKNGSYGLAFQQGAAWSDEHPSKEVIEKILVTCHEIKSDENSEFAPLADVASDKLDSLINKIKERL